MAKVFKGALKTKIAKHDLLKSRLTGPLAGAAVGIVVSLPLSAAIVTPFIQSDFATVTPPTRVIVEPADALSCVAPVSSTGSGSGAPASMPSHKSNTKPSAPAPWQPTPQKQFITKLVGGVYASNTSVNENNGPNGKAISVNTNIINNTNVSNVSNSTDQNSNSGKVQVTGNNGASGNIGSGDTGNTNGTSITTQQVN